jgi:hypothetical protein
VAQLREFPDFRECRFNEAVNRWEFVFLSVAGVETSQFLGWYKNPLTGQAIEPDPVTGLLPFRDLDDTAQAEILENCKRTFLGNRADGAGTWQRQFDQARAHNTHMRKESARKRGEDFAYLISQMDLRRPWVKYHQRGAKQTFIPKKKAAAPTPTPGNLIIAAS